MRRQEDIKKYVHESNVIIKQKFVKNSIIKNQHIANLILLRVSDK
jgi:hypothetical protein